VQQLNTALREKGALDTRLAEIVIATTGREMNSQYQWLIHGGGAARAGAGTTVLDAIRDDRDLKGLDERDAVAIALVRELFREGRARTETFAAATRLFGARGAVEIAALAGSDAIEGVCAEVSPYPYADAAELLARPDPFIVALDEVTDPQNLGAVIRTAECAGVTGVVIPERRSAEVTGAVAKASAGAVEHLPVARVRNLADFLGEAKEAGCWTYGAAAGSRTRYDAPDYSGGVVLVLGAEGRGLRPRVAGACDELVSLPLLGRIDSLNVSAAGAVLMYEILQKRLDAST
jgi:23S rRNA (guanosine2251-2'-O)-methyltransferase